MGVTLRQRIFWWSVGSTLVILLVAFLFVNQVFRNTILRDQSDAVVARLRLADQLLDLEIGEYHDRMGGLARTPTLRAAIETGDSLTIRENLEPLLEGSGLVWLAFSTPEGRILASTAEAPRERLAGSEIPPLVAQSQSYDTGDLWHEGDGLMQVYATGISLGGIHLGALLGGQRIGPERVARLESTTQQSVAFLADGEVVAGGEGLTDMEREDLAEVWAQQEAAAGDSVQSALVEPVREFTLRRRDYLGASAALPNARGQRVGSLVTFRSLEEALAPARQLRLALLAIALGGILLAFASSYLLSRRVIHPVNRLLRETVRLGSGNLDEPIRPDRNDEIGALAAGFEQMRVSLRDAREGLLRAERLSAVGRAAAAIVHDFRQPVTAIQGHVGLLKVEGDDAVQRQEDLLTIENELARLNGMMNELLEFGRGSEAVKVTTGPVPNLLEEVTTSVWPLFASKEIALNVDCNYKGDWRFDFPRIRRVLENLVRNAAAAVDQGGTVWVSTEETADGLRFVVEDTGPGIPEEVRDTLFEPFVTFGKREGTGLGLAIVKTLTERNGGTVRFETSSSGTRFLLDFPRKGAA